MKGTNEFFDCCSKAERSRKNCRYDPKLSKRAKIAAAFVFVSPVIFPCFTFISDTTTAEYLLVKGEYQRDSTTCYLEEVNC